MSLDRLSSANWNVRFTTYSKILLMTISSKPELWDHVSHMLFLTELFTINPSFREYYGQWIQINGPALSLILSSGLKYFEYLAGNWDLLDQEIALWERKWTGTATFYLRHQNLLENFALFPSFQTLCKNFMIRSFKMSNDLMKLVYQTSNFSNPLHLYAVQLNKNDFPRSVLSTWDPDYFFPMERFSNYLLNPAHMMKSYSPMEKGMPLVPIAESSSHQSPFLTFFETKKGTKVPPKITPCLVGSVDEENNLNKMRKRPDSDEEWKKFLL